MLSRLALACVVLALPGIVLLGGQSSAGPTATRIVLNPEADAYVTSSRPSRNYGAAAELRVAARPATRSYLTFRLGELTRPIARARIDVMATHARPGAKTLREGVVETGADA